MNLKQYVRSVWPPLETAKNYTTILNYYSDDRNSKKYGRSPHNGILLLDLIRNYLGDGQKTYLEIGVMFGSSIGLVLLNKNETKCIGVDLFESQTYKSLENPYDCSIEKIKPIIDDFNIHNKEYHLVKGDSMDIDTIQTVSSLIPEGCDILFIDGNHEEDYVYSDFINYSKFVNSGGYIVFDDYLTCKGIIHSLDKLRKEMDLKDYEFIGVVPPFSNEYVIKRM
jgi:predicted O-methyltransferase YrrM